MRISSVHTYVYLCNCVYACFYACLCMWVRVFRCKYICIYTCVFIEMYLCVQKCLCLCVCIFFMCIHVCMYCECTYVHLWNCGICVFLLALLYVCVRFSMYLYMRIYMCLWFTMVGCDWLWPPPFTQAVVVRPVQLYHHSKSTHCTSFALPRERQS